MVEALTLLAAFVVGTVVAVLGIRWLDRLPTRSASGGASSPTDPSIDNNLLVAALGGLAPAMSEACAPTSDACASASDGDSSTASSD